MRNAYKIFVGNRNGRGNLKNVDVDGRIIDLKVDWIFREYRFSRLEYQDGSLVGYSAL
jgi:hypothetical protein